MHTRTLTYNTTALLAFAYLACLSPAQAQQSLTLSVPVFNSPHFANTLGTGFFENSGRTTTLLLAPGVPLHALFDDSLTGHFNQLGTNNDPTVTFSSTVVTP